MPDSRALRAPRGERLHGPGTDGGGWRTTPPQTKRLNEITPLVTSRQGFSEISSSAARLWVGPLALVNKWQQFNTYHALAIGAFGRGAGGSHKSGDTGLSRDRTGVMLIRDGPNVSHRPGRGIGSQCHGPSPPTRRRRRASGAAIERRHQRRCSPLDFCVPTPLP